MTSKYSKSKVDIVYYISGVLYCDWELILLRVVAPRCGVCVCLNLCEFCRFLLMQLAMIIRGSFRQSLVMYCCYVLAVFCSFSPICATCK